jgi:hypothetical protein
MLRRALPLLLAAGCIGCGSAALQSSLATDDSSAVTATSDPTSSPSMVSTSDPTTEPASTEPARPDWTWLVPFGTEAPMPTVPEGWQVMDVGAVRFAVPADWQAPRDTSCLTLPAGGIVLLPFLQPTEHCSPSLTLPDNQLTITRADVPLPTTPPDAKLGDLDAWQTSDSPTTYRLPSGVEVSAAGPDAPQILATFTTSGAHRALQDGPLVDTSDWKSVTFHGVSLLVPATFEQLDLAHQDHQQGFMPDPGTCDYGWFAWMPRALVDTQDPHITVSCAVSMAWPTVPADGVWMRTLDGAQLTPTASGNLGGLEVSIVQPDLPGDATVSPIIDLVIHSAPDDVRVSIGVGTDPSVARTILRSVHATGEEPVAPSSTVPAPTTPTNAAATASTAPVRAGLDPDPIRVSMDGGCPASVAGHPETGSTAAEWISNPDATGLDDEFVPGTPTAALICRYVALGATTTFDGQVLAEGALLSSTVLDSQDAVSLARVLNAIVPWDFTSGCIPPDDKARYTAITFAAAGRDDVDVWLKDWYNCPEVSNGRRFSGELVNGQGSAFIEALNGLVPPAPDESGIVPG